MRFAIDSNILVYAFDREAGTRHVTAKGILIRALRADCVIPTQAVGEFLNVVRRKRTSLTGDAIDQARHWSLLVPTIDTAPDQLFAAMTMAHRHKLQFWDCVIWQVGMAAGAELFLSEDMQDGFTHGGMHVMNPFLPHNSTRLDLVLAESDAE